MEENKEQGRGCLGMAGGCLIKIIEVILVMIVLAGAKACSRSMMRNRLQYGETQIVNDNKCDIEKLIYNAMAEVKVL